jgi:hypothetical protein
MVGDSRCIKDSFKGDISQNFELFHPLRGGLFRGFSICLQNHLRIQRLFIGVIDSRKVFNPFGLYSPPLAASSSFRPRIKYGINSSRNPEDRTGFCIKCGMTEFKVFDTPLLAAG